MEHHIGNQRALLRSRVEGPGTQSHSAGESAVRVMPHIRGAGVDASGEWSRYCETREKKGVDRGPIQRVLIWIPFLRVVFLSSETQTSR